MTASIVGHFSKQLAAMMDVIEATSPHFIRCIKPNNDKVPNAVHRVTVLRQLSCCGVLEAARVSRTGYPVRFPLSAFVRKYCVLVPPSVRSMCAAALRAGSASPVASARVPTLKLAACAVVDAIDGLRAGAEVGNTKVFLRQSGFLALEGQYNKCVANASVTLQRTWRGCCTRRRVAALRGRIVRAQALARGHLQRLAWRRVLAARAATVIAAAARGAAGRRRHAAFRGAVRWAQRTFRARMLAAKMKRVHGSMVRLQAVGRGRTTRRRLARRVVSATVVQRWWRRCAATAQAREVVTALRAARVLTSAAKVWQARRRCRSAAVVLRRHRCARCIQRLARRAAFVQRLGAAVSRLSAQRQQRQRVSAALHRWRTTVAQSRAVKHAAARIVQATWRHTQARRAAAAAVVNAAARTVTRAVQTFVRNGVGQRVIHAACTIQAAWFMHRLHTELCGAALSVQRVARAWLGKRNAAAAVVQRFVRSVSLADQLHRTVHRWRRSAATIQALWRGVAWRQARRTASERASQRMAEDAESMQSQLEGLEATLEQLQHDEEELTGKLLQGELHLRFRHAAQVVHKPVHVSLREVVEDEADGSRTGGGSSAGGAGQPSPMSPRRRRVLALRRRLSRMQGGLRHAAEPTEDPSRAEAVEELPAADDASLVLFHAVRENREANSQHSQRAPQPSTNSRSSRRGHREPTTTTATAQTSPAHSRVKPPQRKQSAVLDDKAFLPVPTLASPDHCSTAPCDARRLRRHPHGNSGVWGRQGGSAGAVRPLPSLGSLFTPPVSQPGRSGHTARLHTAATPAVAQPHLQRRRRQPHGADSSQDGRAVVTTASVNPPPSLLVFTPSRVPPPSPSSLLSTECGSSAHKSDRGPVRPPPVPRWTAKSAAGSSVDDDADTNPAESPQAEVLCSNCRSAVGSPMSTSRRPAPLARSPVLPSSRADSLAAAIAAVAEMERATATCFLRATQALAHSSPRRRRKWRS